MNFDPKTPLPRVCDAEDLAVREKKTGSHDQTSLPHRYSSETAVSRSCELQLAV